MRLDVIGQVVGHTYRTPMLDGMPEGTEFMQYVDADRGVILARMFTPPNNWSEWVIDLADMGLLDDSGALDRIDEALRDLRDFHWRATLNAWPGWRW